MIVTSYGVYYNNFCDPISFFFSLSVTGLGVAAPNAAFASMVNVFGLAGIVGKHFCDLSQDWEAA